MFEKTKSFFQGVRSLLVTPNLIEKQAETIQALQGQVTAWLEKAVAHGQELQAIEKAANLGLVVGQAFLDRDLDVQLRRAYMNEYKNLDLEDLDLEDPDFEPMRNHGIIYVEAIDDAAGTIRTNLFNEIKVLDAAQYILSGQWEPILTRRLPDFAQEEADRIKERQRKKVLEQTSEMEAQQVLAGLGQEDQGYMAPEM